MVVVAARLTHIVPAPMGRAVTADVVTSAIMAVSAGGRADRDSGDQRKGKQTHGDSSYACVIAALRQRWAQAAVPADHQPDHTLAMSRSSGTGSSIGPSGAVTTRRLA